MKKNIKIIVAVMCVLVVGASLVGCSCSSTDNKTNSTTTQSANGKNGTANSKDANNTNASANNGANANANNGANANANANNNDGSGNSAAPAAAPESKGTGIVGTFRYVDSEIPELVSTYVFNQDGTGQYDLCGEKLDLTYKTNGNILSITFAGQNIPMDVEYTVNADALTIKDVTGNDLVYHRV